MGKVADGRRVDSQTDVVHMPKAACEVGAHWVQYVLGYAWLQGGAGGSPPLQAGHKVMAAKGSRHELCIAFV